MTLLVSAAGGLFIGLCLGLFGSGGSVLAVPLLVYGLGQSPVQATSGSLVVVASASLVGGALALRAGTALLREGLCFAVAGTPLTLVGARTAQSVSEIVLLRWFVFLLAVVAVSLLARLLRPAAEQAVSSGAPAPAGRRKFARRAVTYALAGSAAGFLTGFFGVGGGFFIVPTLMLALALPLTLAVSTSLVVISLNSLVALSMRVELSVHPDWIPILLLVAFAVPAVVLGGQVARHFGQRALELSYASILTAVAVGMAGHLML